VSARQRQDHLHSRLFSAWYFAHRSGANIITCSHTQEFAETTSGHVRRIVNDHAEVLGYELRNKAKGRWDTTNGRDYLAGSNLEACPMSRRRRSGRQSLPQARLIRFGLCPGMDAHPASLLLQADDTVGLVVRDEVADLIIPEAAVEALKTVERLIGASCAPRSACIGEVSRFAKDHRLPAGSFPAHGRASHMKGPQSAKHQSVGQ
jgi:hypothetical protein